MNPIIAWSILIVFGYLLGGIPVGLLIARTQGVDIFKVGSGNIGATNVWRALGPKWGLTVFLLDLTKGLIPAIAGRLLEPHGPQIGWAVAGLAAMFGHSMSPWIKFKGGKGVATLMGAVMGASPLVSITSFGIFLVLLMSARLVSLASLVAVASSMFWAYIYHDTRPMYVVYILAFVLTVVRHRSNISRLIKGEEPKFTFKKSV